MIPANMLPMGLICGEAVHLERVATVEDRRRDAFVAAVLAADAPTAHRERAEQIRTAAFGGLTSDDQATISGWFADYCEDVRRGVIPEVHSFDVVLAMDGDGRVTSKPDTLSHTTVIGSADCAWSKKEGDNPTIAVVLQHRSESGDHTNPADDLGDAFLGLAWAQTMALDRAQVGRCFHKLRGEPRYLWSPILEERDLEAIWAKVRGVITAKKQPTMGFHCERCRVRLSCPAWLTPPLHLAADALRPFQGRNGYRLTKENAPRALRMVMAMRDALNICEAQLRTWARDEGGIPDGHGRVWGPHATRKGEVFEWHTVKG